MRLPGRHVGPRGSTASAGPPDTQDLDLSLDPFDDDLGDQLAASAPRRIANRATVVLAGAVLVIGGFIGGALVQKHVGTPAAASANTTGGGNLAGGFAGGNGGQGRRGGQGTGSGTGTGSGSDQTAAPASGTLTGTVKLIDGTTIYIQTSDGRTVTVRTTGSTSVQITQPGTVKDLAVGSTVTVEAPDSEADTVTATKVTKAQ
jgi:hypothetical protein